MDEGAPERKINVRTDELFVKQSCGDDRPFQNKICITLSGFKSHSYDVQFQVLLTQDYLVIKRDRNQLLYLAVEDVHSLDLNINIDHDFEKGQIKEVPISYALSEEYFENGIRIDYVNPSNLEQRKQTGQLTH